jgi:hypothetical protein
MLLSLILGTTAIGALGTVLLTGTKEKKNNELQQKPTISYSPVTIDKSINNCFNKENIHNDKNDDKEVINAIRELFREQEQLSQDEQDLLNDIMANNQELARLIRK